MKGNTLLIILAAMLLAPALAIAQVEPGPSNPKSGYLGWDDEAQSRNLPAGTVQDPGSHLTYIVDTGLNARMIAGLGDLAGVSPARRTPLQPGSLLQPFLDPDGDGQLNEGTIWQNFVAIANTHPYLAVTVHFRYYNDNCEDLLDFLVVLTCNDTLIFDPFNFVIPYTGGVNTRTRLIGPATEVLTPISVIQWGSGRFVITAAASATTRNWDDAPDILFPEEWKGLDEKCNIETNGDLIDTVYTVAGLDAKIAGFDSDAQGLRNVGTVPGFNRNNLHAFNASQICFNYLIGHLTTAIPGSFASGPGADAYLSYGYAAWARPVVDRGEITPGAGPWSDDNENQEGFAGSFMMPNPPSNHVRRNVSAGPHPGANPDGDGPHSATALDLPHAGALNYLIAWGGEPGRDSAGNGPELTDAASFTNHKFLRNDVHGGDIAGLSYSSATMPGFAIDKISQRSSVVVRGSDSWYGAMATTPFHITDPTDQLIHFLSVADDYNGSSNALTSTGILSDISANIAPAVTTYVLQIYDNDGNILTYDAPPGFQPDPPQMYPNSIILKMTCICLRAFRNFRNEITKHHEFFGGTSVDSLTLEELSGFGMVFQPVIEFRGLLKPLYPWRTAGSRDSSGGWIRFVRDNTVRVYVPRDTGTSVEGAFAAGYGTSSFNLPRYSDNDLLYGQSFLTIGLQVMMFEGFGTSWWMHAVPSDPRVSESGHQDPKPGQGLIVPLPFRQSHKETRETRGQRSRFRGTDLP